jgi:fructose-1,6-bisphosphatase/inositol monophosphatase family enzyme
VLEALRVLALEAALAAGQLQRQGLAQARTIEFKGAVDLVTQIDRASSASPA